MSLYRDHELRCPWCGATSQQSVAVSLDAASARREREEILAGTFQRFSCQQCGKAHVADGPLIYIDFENKHWLGVLPRPWESAWWQWEKQPEEAFTRNMVDNCPPIVRSWSPDFTIRTVFGLPALREKLLCFDAGIDDRALEALKLDFMRTSPDSVFALEGRPRLVAVDDRQLGFYTVTEVEQWPQISDEPQKVVVNLSIPRAQLDRFNDPVWQATLDAVSRGPYVDVGRLILSDDNAETDTDTVQIQPALAD